MHQRRSQDHRQHLGPEGLHRQYGHSGTDGGLRLCGHESGNNVTNKVEKAGWHTTKSEFVDAPVIDELPMAVECRLISYDQELPSGG